ncbi:MAG: AcvB/VirJ family lysyl-phosphatidylglycerol hydrolase [Thermoanaerobaculia bacterium]
MARRFSIFCLLLGLLPAVAGAAQGSFKLGRFGTVSYVGPEGEPKRVVLLLSGDQGTGEREAAMAKELAAAGSLVFQVDTPHYFSTAGNGQGRLYPAVNFEVLSQAGQKEAEVKAYHQPVLVGTGIGATLAYIALAESPSDTFAGAVSDGFCAVLASDQPFRRGNGLETDLDWKGPGIRLLPNPAIQNPWLLLEHPGLKCATGAPSDFLKAVGTAKPVPAPAGVAPQEAWRKQLPKALAVLDEYQRQMDAKMAARGDVKDLPLVEVESQGPAKDALAVIVTGSGGFVGLDRKMGNQLTGRGVPVVGLSSLGYFWQVRTPQGSSEDLARILRHYLAAWHKSRAIVIGYSQGADVVPYMVSRLPADLRSKIGVVALIGPDAAAQFDMPPDGWVSKRPRLPELPVAAEIPRLKGYKVLCIYGAEEKENICKSLPAGAATLVEAPGGHGFEGDAPKLAERFLREAGVDTEAKGGQAKGKP